MAAMDLALTTLALAVEVEHLLLEEQEHLLLPVLVVLDRHLAFREAQSLAQVAVEVARSQLEPEVRVDQEAAARVEQEVRVGPLEPQIQGLVVVAGAIQQTL